MSPGALERRPLGDSGIDVSFVGLGGNNFGLRIDAETTTAVVSAALEAGITFFDTADMYGDGESEVLLGRALGGLREEVVVATKFGYRNGFDFGAPKGSAAHVRRSTEDSLRRLGTDYIDLQYHHSPDPETPVRETLEALWELMDEGKIRAIGCSNYSADQLQEAEDVAQEAGRPHFCVLQAKYNIVARDAREELIPLCRELGIGFVPWYPLHSGLLSGKYVRGAEPPAGSRLEAWKTAISDEEWEQAAKASAFAEARGLSLLELALGGLASESAVTSIIAGATSPAQVEQNVLAAQTRLSEPDVAALAAL